MATRGGWKTSSGGSYRYAPSHTGGDPAAYKQYDWGGGYKYQPGYPGPAPTTPYKGSPPARYDYRDLRESRPSKPPPGGTWKKYTLPLPGPKAGGRYNFYHWQPPAPGNRLGLPSPFRKIGKFGKNILRFNPYMRFLDAGFQIMNLWTEQQPTEEEFKPGSLPSGWTISCYNNGMKWDDGFTGINQAFTSCPGGVCEPIYVNPLSSGPYGRYNQTPSPIRLTGPTGTKQSALLGPSNGVPGAAERFAIKLKVCRLSPTTGQPPNMFWDPFGPRAPMVMPQPADLAPPKPQETITAQPRPRTSPKTGPRIRTPTDTQTGGTPGYVNPPDGHVNVPNPRGVPKWKIPHSKLGDLYGKLTELGDALDCLEKAMIKRPPGPKPRTLQDRLINAATRIYHNPHSVDWPKFVACVIQSNFEDFVVGKANSLANNITKNKYWTRPVGVGAGGFAVRMN